MNGEYSEVLPHFLQEDLTFLLNYSAVLGGITMIYDDIKRLAYIKWITAGFPEGKDTELWLAAEKEVLKIRNQMNPFQANRQIQI